MKKKLLKTFFAFGIFISMGAIGQNVQTASNTFVVVTKIGTEEANLVSKSIEHANLNDFRLRETRRKLTFDNGVVVELLSATEMKALGYKTDLSFYIEKLDKNYIEPVFSIAPNGVIMQQIQKLTTTKY